MNKDYRTASSFIKEFAKIKGFSETKVFFSPNSRPQLHGINVQFVFQNRLCKIKMYMNQFEINQWRESFEEFFATGIFPNKVGWKYYPDDAIDPNDIGKVYYFATKIDKDGYIDVHSKEMLEALTAYREKYPNCGIKRNEQ